MKNNYKVKVNNSLDFNLTDGEIKALDIVDTNNSKFHILQNNTPFNGTIIKSDFNRKKYTIAINNNHYEVAIVDELDALIAKMGFEIGKTKKVNVIKAPMPGLVLDINVKVGDTVKEDETLLILEAMKMENSITSPRDGIIDSISVNKGDAIDKGTLLIKFKS